MDAYKRRRALVTRYFIILNQINTAADLRKSSNTKERDYISDLIHTMTDCLVSEVNIVLEEKSKGLRDVIKAFEEYMSFIN